jgi:protein O-GlcNAc transferase
MTQSSLQQTFDLARQHLSAGRLAEAEELYRQILLKEPYHPDVLHLLGMVTGQTGRIPEAIDLIAKAHFQRPDDPAIAGDLGVMLQLAGRFDLATDVYKRVLELKPDSAEAWFNLGQTLHFQKRFAESKGAFAKALELGCEDVDIHNRYGVFLRDSGDEAGALEALARAIELRPDHAEALANCASLFHKQGNFAQAVAGWRRALQANPRDAATAYNLGTVLRDASMLDEAIAVLRQSVEVNPGEPKAWNNLAGLYKDAGDLDQSLACYDRAIALRPESAATYSNRLYTLHFHPDFDAKKLLAEHREYARRHIEKIRPARNHDNDRDPDRALNIGYVSADFRRHPVGLSFQYLLENHDRQRFKIFCFSSVPRPDSQTQSMERSADQWHSVGPMSDEQLAKLVRDCKIDILVDLSLHMAHNRLTMLARKPAPVQVTYLGYPSTTGVGAIDYRLSDAVIDPPGTDANYTEQTIRLPRTYMCWRWGGKQSPAGTLPAKRNGYVTFGCLNNFCKVTPAVLDLWGKVMARATDSRLLLRSPAGSAADRVTAALGKHGIERGRVEFVGQLSFDDYVKVMARQDVGLDPFPYPGHTTSLDSFWMGVPVVTLVGDTGVSRVGASLLEAIGLPELIGQSAEQFVAIAVSVANDLPKLAQWRAGLRQRVAGSPICDGAGFARDVEGVYRDMWRRWVRSGS